MKGDHFWNFMESDLSFHFDLKCNKCDTLVKLDELVGLMICTGCDQTCEVDIIRRELEPENVRVCIALGQRPVDERKQLPQEKISIIEDYVSQHSYADFTHGICPDCANRLYPDLNLNNDDDDDEY